MIGGQIARLDTYACANCGYVETYISADRKLYYIAKMWETVPLQPEPPTDLDKTRRLPPPDGETRRL